VRVRLLLGGLALAAVPACSGFDLGPEPEPIPAFGEVPFAEALGIDTADFASVRGIWVRTDPPAVDSVDLELPGAEEGDVVQFWYEGWVFDGTPFDAVRPGDGEAARLRLGAPGPMPGLSRTLIGMRPGERRTAAIPPELAFGALGAPPVPPDAWVVLQVELVGLEPAAPEDG
jgi:hypothetical protein